MAMYKAQKSKKTKLRITLKTTNTYFKMQYTVVGQLYSTQLYNNTQTLPYPAQIVLVCDKGDPSSLQQESRTDMTASESAFGGADATVYLSKSDISISFPTDNTLSINFSLREYVETNGESNSKTTAGTISNVTIGSNKNGYISKPANITATADESDPTYFKITHTATLSCTTSTPSLQVTVTEI